ncbi:MAG: N-methyl-L-tryptophan oxidase [Candidatus Dormibacteria bacterium]
MESAEAIVIGLGAMGSATLYQLARRGVSVLGIDRFTPPHTRGSTHGDTRITRLAIAEGPDYVPLVLRSHELWRELEAETGLDLLTVTGALVMDDAAGDAAQGATGISYARSSIAVAERYGIEHEVLDAEGIAERFPRLRPRRPTLGYHEPGGGLVRPERAVEAQLRLAERAGARAHTGERVLRVRAEGSGVAVETDRGRYAAGQVVLSAGPWLATLLDDPDLGALFGVYRQVLHWFAVPDLVGFEPGSLPVFLANFGSSRKDGFYGFPAVDGISGGVKVATEQYELGTHPDQVEREVSQAEIAAMLEICGRGGYQIGPRHLRSATCLYTVTPDHDFVIDRHPEQPGLLLVSPCSGHGFKHSAAIGEAVAELVCGEPAGFDLSAFALSRLLG